MAQSLTTQSPLTDQQTVFNPLGRLQQAAKEILALAAKAGATQTAVHLSASQGFSVDVRMGDVERVEHERDQSVGITLYFGKRKGEVSSSDIRSEALQSVVKKACYIADRMGEDPCYGLPEPEQLANVFLDLKLDHPWNISTAMAIDLALRCEAMALNTDKRITNSDGMTISSQRHATLYVDSQGFNGSLMRSNHSLSCCMIASEAGKMERDASYAIVRDPVDFPSLAAIARESVEKSLNRLGAVKVPSCRVPVIFQAEVASSLIRHFLSAINGYNLYKDASFLVGKRDQSIFPSFVEIYESPHLIKGLGSRPFDSEGVATYEKAFVHEGRLQNYLLDSYSARRLNMTTTGNAGGAHNVLITPTAGDLGALLKQMDRGLLVTDLMGQGVNLVTGDYSRGASGFWVERGEIQYPVSEITVVGNLKQMYANLVAVGKDIYPYNSIQSGSLLIENMVVAGD